MRPYIAFTVQETKLTLRAPAALFFNYMVPLAFFLLFAAMFHVHGSGTNRMFTMSILTGALGNGLFGAGLRLAQDREQNILRRLRTKPISPLVLLVGTIVSGWLYFLPSIVTTYLVAHFAFAMPFPEHPLQVVIVVSAGVIAFRAIGLGIGAVVGSAQESLIASQSLYLPFLLLSGATIPMAIFPHWLSNGASVLPSFYFYSSMQSLLVQDRGIIENAAPVLILLAAAAIALGLAVALFRWDSSQKTSWKARLAALLIFAPMLAVGAWRVNSGEHLKTIQGIDRASGITFGKPPAQAAQPAQGAQR